MKLLPAVAASVAITALSVSTLIGPAVFIYYNPSPSAPRGWYARVPLLDTRPGQLVLVRLPDSAARLANDRHYLPRGTPALKQIAAHGGDKVCECNGTVLINNRVTTQSLMRDARGRVLRPWTGCRTLKRDELFLLNTNHPASFDSRYYGPVSTERVLGAATPIWTVEEGGAKRPREKRGE